MAGRVLGQFVVGDTSCPLFPVSGNPGLDDDAGLVSRGPVKGFEGPLDTQALFGYLDGLRKLSGKCPVPAKIVWTANVAKAGGGCM